MADHGGSRTGAGRKRHVPPLKKRCVAMTDKQARLLRMWGKGDLSAGLRWLIDRAATMIQHAEKKVCGP
jgi:hypothetical protein